MRATSEHTRTSLRYFATWVADLLHGQRRERCAVVCDRCNRLVPSRRYANRFAVQAQPGVARWVWRCESCQTKHVAASTRAAEALARDIKRAFA